MSRKRVLTVILSTVLLLSCVIWIPEANGMAGAFRGLRQIKKPRKIDKYYWAGRVHSTARSGRNLRKKESENEKRCILCGEKINILRLMYGNKEARQKCRNCQ